MRSLESIHVSRVVLAELSNLLLSLALHAPVLLTRKLSLVKTLEVEVDGSVNADRKDKHANRGTVAGTVMGLVFVAEQERGGNTSGVSNGNEDTTSEGTLAISWLIDSDPSHTRSRAGPKTNSNNEASSIAHSSALVGNQKNVADYHSQTSSDAEKSSLLGSIADVGTDQIGNEAHGVHRDCETLHLLVGPLTHLLDDGWQEDTEAVQDRVTAVLSNGESPNGPVLGPSDDVFLVHLLTRCCLTNLRCSQVQEVLSVLLSEELGGCGSVRQDPWDENSCQDGGDTVDGENPSPGSPAGSTLSFAIPVVKLTDTEGNKTTDGSRDSRDGVKVGVAK